MIAVESRNGLFHEAPSMQDFYRSFELSDYPFNVYTAENESQYSGMLFIHPLNYDAIKSSFDGNRSIIIRGNRGTGKTALLVDLQQNIPSDALFCVIDDYTELQLPPTTTEYYILLIKSIVAALFLKLFDEKERLKRLDKDDKLFLSFLLSEYTSPITQRELTRKIEAIQLSKFRQFVKNKADIIRAVLNYGLTAGLNVVNDIIRNYYAGLPLIEESQIREIVPKFDFDAETDFNASVASYQLLLRICSLIEKLGYQKITAFFDKFDEDNRMENNAEIVSEFIKPLMTDNKLLENTSIQIIISIWEVPFSRILSTVRTQKHHCPQLSWPIHKLRDALNTRISVFSNNSICDYRNLFSSDVSQGSIEEIFYLCNGNPRDLWHIFDRIFQAQYAINANSRFLSEQAVKNGLDDFVTTFNFYEYYPRKANAKANSMDVYGYIKHLLKLSTETFTKNQLNDAAKIGSSISNYVVGMENIGLVVKTNEKYKSGVVYRINDPKVIYAIKNQLDIAK